MVRKVTTTTLPKCENALECLEHPRAITHKLSEREQINNNTQIE